MRRVTQNILLGTLVAATAGMFMRRNNRNNIMNRTMNSTINMMGRLGLFRLMGRSRMFGNLIRMR